MQENQAGQYKHHKTSGAQGRTGRTQIQSHAGMGRLKPMVHTLAWLLAAGAAQQAQAQQAFSPAWFANKGVVQNTAASTGYLPNGTPVSALTNPTQQQQQANAQLQQSISNLSILARGIAAQQAAQAAARQAALANGSSVPDGLVEGGLKVDTDSLTKGWINANAPTQTTANGKTTVAIQQTADKAILNWETFNVGKNTILSFAQDASWAVLNRVNDPQARPSQIQGQINAPGTVMIANRNGVIFSGSSQIDTRNLVAAAANITDAQFRDKGLYVDSTGSAPTFTDALGKIEVQAGAQLATKAATSATESGGYVLLMGSETSNAGQINTPGGQTTLAAGDSFYIRKGLATDGNKNATTRGNEVSASDGGDASGLVQNTGLITASTGDITLTGHEVVQGGVAVSTTSVSTRGTIHLLNRAGDATGSVTLAEGSVTGIVLDTTPATALDSQRDAAQIALSGSTAANNITANFDNLSLLQDRTDLSRIEIVSGNTVEFKDASTTLATGGQIAVTAANRSLVANGAVLDVSGAVGVNLAMDSNNIQVNVQGNELRDASVNRESTLLNNSDVWIDKRSLVRVAAGTNGYTTDRWYTAGGLLEVSGYLGTQSHAVGEWMAQGGTVTFSGNDVVTQSRSNINLSGGTLNVASGYINQSWLKGADGRLYEISTAPGDLQYTGVYKGFEVTHARWGDNTAEHYYNPLIAPQRVLQDGYTVGRDAGKLVISTNAAVLEGNVTAETFQGARQTKAAQAGVDSYKQAQDAVAQRGQLIIGDYRAVYDSAAGALRYRLNPLADDVSLTTQVEALADEISLNSPLAPERAGSIVLDSTRLNQFGLGGLIVGANKLITVDGALALANGGSITLYAPQVAVNANITAHAGSMNLGNVLQQYNSDASSYSDTVLSAVDEMRPAVTVADGVRLDASGLWSNQLLDPSDISGVPAINGGTVSIRSTGDMMLGQGSVVDVTSGAAQLASGKTSDGTGGSVRLQSGTSGELSDARMVLDGALQAYGVNGGGTLTIDTGRIVIGGDGSEEDALNLAADSFNKGFSNYRLNGLDGVAVADGAQVNVFMPVWRVADGAGAQPAASKASAIELWTPPVYQEDLVNAKLTQRKGASIALQAGSDVATEAASRLNTSAIRIGSDAGITVDPGQSISLVGNGQITVDRGARLNAWGGNITIGQIALPDTDWGLGDAYVTADKHSIWIGENAVLDAAARAVTAVDAMGRTYGLAGNGGKITLGGTVNTTTGNVSTQNLHVFVVLRDGAVLDASGAQATLDVEGMGKTVVAGNGGSIAIASGEGLYLDGVMRAAAGGAKAAGGSLSIAQDAASYVNGTVGDMTAVRELLLTQRAVPSDLAAGISDTDGNAQLVYGYSRLGVDQVQAGGFGQLTLFGRGGVAFEGDIDLGMAQSLSIYAPALNQRAGDLAATSVKLAAPYVQLSGVGQLTTADRQRVPEAATAVIPTEPASLHLQGDLIDVRDEVKLGFSDNLLDSSGDLRFQPATFVGNPGTVFQTVLGSEGDITLRAAQVYPVTGANAVVAITSMEFGSPIFTLDRTLRIERNGSNVPDLPYAVLGSLELGAEHVVQGGVLRAPLGALSIGTGGRGLYADKVEFLPGSVTSVSAAGLVMPYGGTVDGITYQVDGAAVKLIGMGGATSENNPVLLQGISVAAKAVDVQAGATLDLSGGGELTGAGFISGRGGSSDVLTSALMQVGVNGTFTLPGLSSNPVYAIVPGAQAANAPLVSPGAAADPMVGQQITISADVAGLPAGTYTLLPSTYALLPGAFRVELNGAAGLGASFAATALRNGSTAVAAQLSVANTTIGDTLFRQAIVTPAATVRTYAQYNEMSYAQFVAADAARLGVPRAMSPIDAKSMTLTFAPGAGADALRVDGTANFSTAGTGTDMGYAGSVNLRMGGYDSSELEILAPGAAATAGFGGVSLHADSLNRLATGRLVVGATPINVYGQSGSIILLNGGGFASITLRSGATLRAPEVLLVTSVYAHQAHSMVIEQGASINTIGQGAALTGPGSGFVYSGGTDVVAVSNGMLNFLPDSQVYTNTEATNGISIGSCTLTPCVGTSELYSEGSISIITPSSFVMDDSVRYGTRALTLGMTAINAGSAQALADAAARGVLPAGLGLNQDVLNRLLAGDTRYGAPALETLTLSARDSFNFYGSSQLSTIDPATGKSTLSNLVLTTPAIYGVGNAGDVALIETGNLIWNGGTTAPAAVITQGAGTGSGTLDIRAERIEFGYGPYTQPAADSVTSRLALGFANVNLTASDRITANHNGSLAVYQSQGAYNAATGGYAYSGGNLAIVTPVLTGEAGSINTMKAGGSLSVSTPTATATVLTDIGLGAELSLAAGDVRIDGTIALPSGKLSVTAERDLLLGAGSKIDMAGRELQFVDVTKASWGGDVTLESSSGNVRQAAGSVIDISATNNKAGSLSVLALDGAAGVADLQGSILGTASGTYDAGGTMVPFLEGSVSVSAQRLGDSGTLDSQFAALNQRLNAGGVIGARSFVLKQGDLTIGNEVKASEVNVSVDNGSLTVAGTIDASGERVGSIRLAAQNNLTLAGNAVLDAHGRTLRVDSYGLIIDSPNRAIVELSSGETGQLRLAPGTTIDLRHGTDATIGSAAGQNDGVARGTLTLNAYRTGETSGDINLNAAGPVNVSGARAINVNAMWRYTDAPDGADPLTTRPYQEITQAYLDAKDLKNRDFINAALNVASPIRGKLAGLIAYTDAFHLRPGVEIASRTADGDLVVSGDLDLSGYRYDSLNPNSQKRTGVAGSGEAGFLTLRAGGNLDIYGSINDGFSAPPATEDDKGWVLMAGKDFTGGDVVIPRSGVVLDDGTVFDAERSLNFDLPIKAHAFDGGQLIPVTSSLAQDLSVTAGSVFSADVRANDGSLLYSAGTKLTVDVVLPTGTRFDAGMRLPAKATLAAMTWPKNVALPGTIDNRVTYEQDGQLTLPLGAIIPSGTNVKLPGGVESVDLRDPGQGKLWAISPMLPEGASSWDLRLVAGADLAAADNRITRPNPEQGSLRMGDTHYGSYVHPTTKRVYSLGANSVDYGGVPGGSAQDLADEFGMTAAELCDFFGDCTVADVTLGFVASSARFSVVRTGAADLDLLAGKDIGINTLYGVYTAGTSSAATSAADPYNLPRVRNADGTVLAESGSLYEKFVDGGADSVARVWYPTGGGNVLVRAGNNLTGNQIATAVYGTAGPNGDGGFTSTNTSNWLWRQGSGSTLGVDNEQLTAWSINFGSFVAADRTKGGSPKDQLLGFIGIGTLGGGNLRVEAGGDAGSLVYTAGSSGNQTASSRSQALALAVASTGRVAADGSLTLTGGGDLDVRIGGVLNPVGAGSIDVVNGGTLVNLRGNVQLQAASMGQMTLWYAINTSRAVAGETRALDPFASSQVEATNGPTLVPGDASFMLSTRGDLIVGGSRDAGRVQQVNFNPLTALTLDPDDPTKYLPTGSTRTGFSLWTDHTAVSLFSAGGNMVPLSVAPENSYVGDVALLIPGVLQAVAASGSLYYGNATAKLSRRTEWFTPMLLAPSANGQLEMLARDSIYAGGYVVSQSGAASSSLATPLRPLFVGTAADGSTVSNLSIDGGPLNATAVDMPLFAFGSGTASAGGRDNGEPTRFYAVEGDLVGVSSGRTVTVANLPDSTPQLWYEGAQPVWMIAGRDIVSGGNRLGATYSNVFVHNDLNDVSIVSAGRDILYSSFQVAGPGTLEITAGGKILMEDKVGINSLGAIVAGDKRPGASIVMQAGAWAQGPDYASLIARYLDPANQADAGLALASQPGKVVKTYERELAAWLETQFGFTGTTEQTLAYYAALPAEQQRIFARQVYYAELTAGGREYNDPTSLRYGSYLRGRNMIATLFPEQDAAGQTLTYAGDITMFGNAGVHTLFGGDIQMLTPGGRQVFGVEGANPAGSAGIITQGAGDIQLYAQGSILLGQSRIMTTFGGDVLAWSATGDINAGRGSKSTVVYTPPKRTYDQWGDVTLSSDVPSTGAGIATLAPIPEVPAGDIDLIAPLGTIDAGEAGIRVSGNVNIAALQVVNAANIQVQGKSAGLPVVAAVNVGALTNASAAASSAAMAAQDAVSRDRAAARQNLPSVFTVRVLGFGNEGTSAPDTGKTSGYKPDGVVQVLGAGELGAAQMQALSPGERKALAR